MICKHCEETIPEHGFACKGEVYKNIGEWQDAIRNLNMNNWPKE